jgi:aryl-alcohol dehydrogenase-like predicted oxidoreductase
VCRRFRDADGERHRAPNQAYRLPALTKQPTENFAMDYRLLGRSGLKVSTITMGTMTFGRSKGGPVGSIDTKDARKQIDQCLDAGVNLIDTANIYAKGQSEEIVGEALGKKRANVLVATKVRFTMGDSPNDKGLSRYHIIRECENSLRRLNTEWIDLYQVHQWDGQTPLEETMEALDRLVQQGKVRYVGCSNYSGWHLMKAMEIARTDGRQPFVSQQIHYSLQAREAEYELVPITLDQGLGILVWSPLAGGLLSGKFRRDDKKGPKGSRHFDRKWKEPPIHDEDKLFDIIDVLVEIGKEHGVSAARVALAWLLRQPGVTSLVIGGRTKEQFADNLAAAELTLTDEDLARLDKVSRPPLAYPYWHQAWTVKDRLSAADLSLIGKYLE